MAERKRAWHCIEDSQEAADRLYACMLSYSERQSTRWAEAIELKRMYDGDRVGGMPTFHDQLSTGDFEPFYDRPVDQTLNFARELVDATISKLTKEHVKPQTVVTDGEWETKRKARICDRFVEGQMQEPQGMRYPNLWAVFGHALRLSLSCTRTAAVKFVSDEKRGKVAAEVHDTLAMFVDTTGAVYDDPRWIGEATWYHPDALINSLGDDCDDETKMAIEAACEVPDKYFGLEYDDDDEGANRDEEIQRVLVVEGWYLAVGDPDDTGEMGRYIRCIKGCVLDDDDWPYEEPPFVFVGGTRGLTGFWHSTLVKPVAPVICQINEWLNGLMESARKTPLRTRFYDPEEHKKEDLVTSEDVELVPVVGLAKGVAPPKDHMPEPYHPLMLQFIQFLIQQMYQIVGISQFNSSGQISGEWSGAALRLLKEQFIERIAPVHRGYVEASVLNATKWITRCAKEVHETSGLKTLWKSDEGFMQEVDASVLALLEDQPHTVDTYTVSEKKNTPEDRLQLFTELTESGLVSGDVLLGVIQHYDTPGALEQSEAQRQMISRQIDKWLMAEPADARKPDFYRDPVYSMNQATAIVQLNNAWMQAMTDEVDQFRLEFFKRYMAKLQEQFQKKQGERAQVAQQAGGTAAATQAVVQGQGGPAM